MEKDKGIKNVYGSLADMRVWSLLSLILYKYNIPHLFIFINYSYKIYKLYIVLVI